MYLYLIILLTITIIVIIIASKSAMLRSEVFNPVNYNAIAATNNILNPKPAFSLSRTQLAFWTVIISSTFIYVVINFSSRSSIIIPELPPVNLVLLGIAAGTTVLGRVIDNSQQNNANGNVAQQDWPSEGFLTDIISDENGISIHRLQNIIWTVIVGVIYVYYVMVNAKIPDGTIINNDLLALMGISAGTYLGLKTTEGNGSSTIVTPTVIQPVQPVIVTPQVVTPAPSTSAQNIVQPQPVTQPTESNPENQPKE